MADPKIRIKRSAVAGRIPSVDQVPLGELALNTWDGQLYASKNVGLGTTVVAINPWLVGTGTDSYNSYFTAGNIGIGSTTPTSTLHVVGDAYISGVVTANAGFNLGISSAGSVITSGPIKTLNFIGAGNTFLVNGTTVDISIQGGGGGGGAEIGVQANDSVIGYAQTTLNFAGTGVTGVSIGTTTTITIEPGLVGAAKSVTSFTATAGQTTFNVNYSQGQENVFRNGIRLSEGGDYTATNGSTVVLTSPASDGDQIDVVVYLRGSDPQRNINVSLSPPFNGITTAFTMYSAGAVFSPVDERQIIVSLGGVVQQPGVAYTVGTGSSIYFSAAPGAATTCFITALYSYTSSNTSLNVAGGYGDLTNLNVSGISTLGTVKVSSGVVTATSGIVTYYGDGSKLSGIQAGYFTQNTTGIHTLGSIGIGTTTATDRLTVSGDASISRHLNVTGVITATTFVKSGGTSSQFLKADGTVDSSTYLTSALQNVVEDTSPQLGGDLDLNSKNVTGTGNISITGVVTASTFDSSYYIINTGTFNFISGSGADLIINGDDNILFRTDNDIERVRISANGNVGIGTTIPQAKLSVENVYGLDTTTTSIASTAATTIDSISTSVFRSAKIQVQITQGTDYQTSDILLIHDGSTTSIVEYASIATNDYLGSFSGALSGGNALLQVSMTSATAATIRTVSQRVSI